MVPDTPLPGASPQAICVRALRAHYSVFPQFSQKARPRRGQIAIAQGAALGKEKSPEKYSSEGADTVLNYNRKYNVFIPHFFSAPLAFSAVSRKKRQNEF